MYSVGEKFTFDTQKGEILFTVIGDVFIKNKEYLITESEEGLTKVFYFNNAEEIIESITDIKESKKLVKEWQDEYYGTINEVDLWEEDYEEEYIEKRHEEVLKDEEEEADINEDLDSYIDNLVSGN